MEGFFFSASESSAWPPVDVYESEDSIVYEIDLPGAIPEDISIKVIGDLLIIEGLRRDALNEARAVNYICIERTSRSFKRVLSIPTPVLVETGDALYKKGVLTITFAKTIKKVHHIPVRSTLEESRIRLNREVLIND